MRETESGLNPSPQEEGEMQIRVKSEYELK
jgi:hypothetical protein